VDSVDLVAAAAHGITVANVPDYCVEEVADHTLLLLLAAARHLSVFQDQVHTRRWLDLEYPLVHRIRGRTLGMIGFGRIGARVAARATAFGLRLLVHDPFADVAAVEAQGGRLVDLDELLARSDIVSLHCPLTPQTHHLLDAAAFSRMRAGVVLVNTSRGALVDLDALDAAMEDGTVAAAGLDVVDGEPAPDLGHPLFRRREVIVTPHIAFYSLDAQADLGTRVADEVERFFAGQAPTTRIQPPAST
jgi:D-3-phosphoglycerate dehydrogenase